jgi:(1->4)-alpha-D-glucan 1-alpha-D-glucosylmutase
MLALSTHDTKRSEDVRARLFLLSEIPEAWEEAVRGWVKTNERHRMGENLPDRNTEYLLYQTMVGAYPLPPERGWAYMEKAVREGKEHTSWTRPDPEYEESLRGFLLELYGDPVFRGSLGAFAERLVGPGRINSLAQKLLQLTVPGVPDLYQGTELWDLSLVDPDNRRPVDFSLRRAVLEDVVGSTVEEVLRRMDRGDPKMWLIHQTLALRKERPGAFGPDGAYRALDARGPARDHLLAFVRGEEVVTAVPRLIMGLVKRRGWGETTLSLPEGQWRSALTGETVTGGAVPVSRLLRRFPVALLARI